MQTQQIPSTREAPAPWRSRGKPDPPDRGAGQGAGEAQAEDQDAAARTREGWWHCARCRARVVPGSASCVREGRHAHTKVNPGGFIFDVRCFDRAPGAMALGLPEAAHTWFAGYAWSFALCRVCSVHLGWAYAPEGSAGGAPEFWGLIAARLVWVEVEAPDA